MTEPHISRANFINVSSAQGATNRLISRARDHTRSTAGSFYACERTDAVNATQGRHSRPVRQRPGCVMYRFNITAAIHVKYICIAAVMLHLYTTWSLTQNVVGLGYNYSVSRLFMEKNFFYITGIIILFCIEWCNFGHSIINMS